MHALSLETMKIALYSCGPNRTDKIFNTRRRSSIIDNLVLSTGFIM